MRKPLNSSVPEELVTRLDEFVISSRGSFRDRSHLVEQAIRNYLGDDLFRVADPSRTAGSFSNQSSISSLYETSLFPRLSLRIKEKQAIAEMAASTIECGKTLFMDGSTTCLELARILAQQKKDLTIVTNSTLICLELGNSHENKVIGVGGEFDSGSASFVGSASEDAIAKFYVDHAFMSTKGFIPEVGTFESTMGTLRIKQIMASHCGRLTLLIDYSKFGQRSLCKVLDITQIHTLITDVQAPKEAIERLQRTGIDVRIASLASL